MQSHDSHMMDSQLNHSLYFVDVIKVISFSSDDISLEYYIFEAVMRIRCTEGTHTLLHLFLLIFLVHMYISRSLSLPTYLIPLSLVYLPTVPTTILPPRTYPSQPSLSGSSLPPPPTSVYLPHVTTHWFVSSSSSN